MSDPNPAGTSALIEDLQRQNRELQSAHDALLNHDVTTWLEELYTRRVLVADYEATFSWRVTAPLRKVRLVQLSVRQRGFAPTARAVASRLARGMRRG